MASITSLSNSVYKSNSIYGSRNVLSGLASGMDTESMIENAISGIKMKIQNLQQKRTKVEWKQEAYRSIIDKAVNFNDKYTSYASKTNLFSASFFNNAVKTETSGKYKDMVSATGKTSSDVKILGVSQMASAASYTLSGSALNGSGALGAVLGEKVNLGEKTTVSAISGSITLDYGGLRQIDLDFGELDNIVPTGTDADGNPTAPTAEDKAKALAGAINKKLSEIQVGNSSGELVKASTMISAEVGEDGSINFKDVGGTGSNVNITYADGDFQKAFGIDYSAKPSSIKVGGDVEFTKDVNVGEYLNGKTMEVTLDGVTKRIDLSGYTDGMSGHDYLQNLQDKLDNAFGKGKITVSNGSPKEGQDGFGKVSNGEFKLELKAQEGSVLSVNSSVNKVLGLSETGAANYLDSSKKLGDLLGKDVWKGFSMVEAEGAVSEIPATKDTPAYHIDSKGNRVGLIDGKYYQVDANNKALYDFKVNGVSVGKFNEDSSLESVMAAINSSAEAGVKVNYSKITNEFKFTATETGAAGKVEFGEGLGQSLFGGGQAVAGKDAIFSMSVNGKEYKNIARGSNTFDVDGLNVTLKGEFTADAADAVTFTSSADADKIVDAVKSMVEDYNAMATEIKNAYSTMPLYNSKKERYEPLTAEQAEGYSESELKAYNEKAKTGILFGEHNLSAMYGELTDAISPNGKDGGILREIGIDTTYSGGITTLNLDEDKLRAALESDPDKVRSAFTKTRDSGSASDGLMKSIQNTLNRYAKNVGEPKGILITTAGSAKAPTSLRDNSLNDEIDNFDKQIERWEEKMSSQIDRYTTQFSKLEQLIAQMNSQSSAFAGLMGGSSGY